jgi:alkylation response protein AidB-like acyl-CoA dehydrogenase
MNFSFSEEQELVRQSAREFLAREAPRARVRAALETAEGFDAALWRRAGELGWLGTLVPEALGGAGLDLLALLPVLEELGRALVPAPFSAHLLGTLALLRAADPEQQRRWLPEAARGARTLTLAVTEAAGRESAGDLALRAVQSGGAWRLHGCKLFVPDARAADAIAVLARSESEGFAWLLVERGAPGVEIAALASMDRTQRLSEVHFDGAPAERLAAPLDAWSTWEWIRDRALVALAAQAVGGADAALEETVAYAKARVQFGAPIGANQVIKHRCADLLLDLEATRALVHQAVWSVAREQPDAALAAAMAKARASDTYRRVSTAAIQIHGGMGFTWESDCHLHFKRAKYLEVTFGDAAAQRERVAEILDARPEEA